MNAFAALSVLAAYASATAAVVEKFSVTPATTTTSAKGPAVIKFTAKEAIVVENTVFTVTFPPQVTVSHLLGNHADIKYTVKSALQVNNKSDLSFTDIAKTNNGRTLTLTTPGAALIAGDVVSITVPEVTNVAEAGDTAVFGITTTLTASPVTTESVEGAKVTLFAACDGTTAAGTAGCNCQTSGAQKLTFTCTAGKTCNTEGTDLETSCTLGDCNVDGETKATAPCNCAAKDGTTDKTYVCAVDQVCDIKATTEKACKARASNGSSLLLLAAFFLAMN